MDRKEIYERVYEKPFAVWTKIKPSKRLRVLIETGKIKPCKTIDMGCGEGFYSVYLAKRGFEVTGIDISDRAINYAKENAIKYGVKIKFLAMDMADLSGLNEKFDFVLEWSVMHGIPPAERAKYVKDVAKLLNKNGTYLSVCFNEQSPEWGGSGRKIRDTPAGMKVYHSSQDELRKLFNPIFYIDEEDLIEVEPSEKERDVGKYFLMNYFLMRKL